MPSMAVVHDFFPYFRVYQDGSVERLVREEQVPASFDPRTRVASKDISISATVSGRLYLPELSSPTADKLPLVIYFRGGAFCMLSSSSAILHTHLNYLVAACRVVLLSVDYRRAPEHRIPVPYDDSWAAVQWATAQRGEADSEPWLADHADFGRVFLAGESAGANIAHNLLMRPKARELGLAGIVLVHPYFWGSRPTAGETAADPRKKAMLDRLWPMVCPTAEGGNDDPRVNPVGPAAPSLARLACARVLVCSAERDAMRDRAWIYYEALRESGWRGEAEIYETAGEDHGFYLHQPEGKNAAPLLARIAAFLGCS